MENNLLDIDNAFVSKYKSLLGIQQTIHKQLKDYPFDLTKTEITDAIIARMDAFWFFNVNNNKEIIDRKINSTAADFFTETCTLFLKCYFEQKTGVVVCSEKNINKSRLRPDISIWKYDKLIAVIELKVNNGWKGKYIMSHLIEREHKVKQHCPDCYFGVVAFWNFFDKSSKDWGKKYVGLKRWDEKNNHPKTGSKIERMMSEIDEYIKKPTND